MPGSQGRQWHRALSIPTATLHSGSAMAEPGLLQISCWCLGLQQPGDHPGSAVPLQSISQENVHESVAGSLAETQLSLQCLQYEYIVHVNCRFVPHIFLEDCMSFPFF